MAKVSTARKLGVVARVATQQAKRSRTFRAAGQAAAATGRAFGRVLHQLWLEVTGVIFLIMALSFGGATVKEYGKYHAGQAGPGRTAIAVCATVTFAWFGISSFLRVKRKGKNALRHE
ncbi:MAG: hypothetical protein WBM24_13800 [Candidatus Sulfotelmatobacter sp.]